MSGFLSRLFNRGARQQGRPRSSSNGGSYLQRAATAPETTTCVSSDEEDGPVLSDVRRAAMRTEDIPGALPVLVPPPRRAGAELRRSQTFSAALSSNGDPLGVYTALSSARQSISSSCDGSLDDQLRKLYGRVKTCHRGKMALIMEGTDRHTKRRVIIKAFSKSNMTETKREKVERELSVLQRTAGCSNVVRMLNTLEDMMNTYLVLESVQGCTLIELMANNGGRLHESRAVPEVVCPLLRGVASLHALGIVHRDIKPEHIMCSLHGSVKLVDFCEAAVQPLQCLNQRVGQLEYMAPEVLSKPSADEIFHQVLYQGMSEQELPQYNEKADVWSVGVVVYEALTGVQPFMAETREELAALHRRLMGERGPSGLPLLLDSPAAPLSQGARSFLEAALRLDPHERASAEQLLQHPWVVGAVTAAAHAAHTVAATAAAVAAQRLSSPAPQAASVAKAWFSSSGAALSEPVTVHIRSRSGTSLDGGLLVTAPVSVR